MNESLTWGELGRDWNQAVIKALGLVPNLFLNREKLSDETTKRDPITKIIVFVIMCLSVASMSNLSHRAFSHHADWSSYFVGGSLAVCVPLSIFVAIHIERKGFKIFVWCLAVAFAVTSGLIQFQVYLPSDPALVTGYKMAEAIAFGFGVPLAECMLAAIEAVLIAQIARKREEEEKSKVYAASVLAMEVETAQRLADERSIILQEAEDKRLAEQQRLADERSFENRKREIELSNLQAEQEQFLLLQRMTLEAKLAAKVSNKVLKNDEQAVEKHVENQQPTGGGVEKSTAKKDKIQQRRYQIFQHIQQHGDPGPSALKDLFGVDRGTIYGDLTALAGENKIYKNGGNKYHAKG